MYSTLEVWKPENLSDFVIILFWLFAKYSSSFESFLLACIFNTYNTLYTGQGLEREKPWIPCLLNT